jgi:FlaG/FlaF family flagellin (archaellin)
MKKTKNDYAVSPVIGVILMVCITVILSAVIASFVFGMTGQVSKQKVVATTVQQPTGTTVIVTYQGGQDAQSFDYALVTVEQDFGKTDVTYTHGLIYKGSEPTVGIPATTGVGSATDNILGTRVGSTLTAHGSFTEKNHVVVVGYFTDTSSQVLTDTFV